jgi:hypothetical protein
MIELDLYKAPWCLFPVFLPAQEAAVHVHSPCFPPQVLPETLLGLRNLKLLPRVSFERVDPVDDIGTGRGLFDFHHLRPSATLDVSHHIAANNE